MKKVYKHVYGPVHSWRLGRSLGIDPVSTDRSKLCSFDCIYCQAGKTRTLTNKRKIYVRTGDILEEIKKYKPPRIDYLTFSGRSEPTLAKNLGEIIRGIRKIRGEKIAVLTNSSMLWVKGVREDLKKADFVAAKLDAVSPQMLKEISKPAKGMTLHKILRGIVEFKKSFRGKFALQIMITRQNKKYAKELAMIAKSINPDEIYINTPLRPSRVKALPEKELREIKKYFRGTKSATVYDAKRKAKP